MNNEPSVSIEDLDRTRPDLMKLMLHAHDDATSIEARQMLYLSAIVRCMLNDNLNGIKVTDCNRG